MFAPYFVQDKSQQNLLLLYANSANSVYDHKIIYVNSYLDVYRYEGVVS